MKFQKGHIMSEETKQKVSNALKGKMTKNINYLMKMGEKTRFQKGLIPWNKGLTNYLSEEAKEAMGNSMKGKKHSEETKRKMSISQKNRPPLTKETKLKMSISRKGFKPKKESIEKYKKSRRNWICPKKDTIIEVKIQDYLKQLGIEFLTHQYIKEIEHGYQCDILIPVQNGIEKKTIIECFGTYWHKYPLARQIDTQRCIELRKAEWRVLVFWENEIKLMELNDLQEVVLR